MPGDGREGSRPDGFATEGVYTALANAIPREQFEALVEGAL